LARLEHNQWSGNGDLGAMKFDGASNPRVVGFCEEGTESSVANIRANH
jgi:hypothetical protein